MKESPWFWEKAGGWARGPQHPGLPKRGWCSAHLSDEQDALKEHVVLVVLAHRLLIHEMSGLQVGVVWEKQTPGLQKSPEAA